MKRILMLSLLATLSNIASSAVEVHTPSDTVNISTAEKSTEDMIILGDGEHLETGRNINYDPKWYLHGYTTDDGAVFDNKNSIKLDGQYNNGILIQNNSSVINKGTITQNNLNSTGILSGDGTGSIINGSEGVINLTTGTGIATIGDTDISFKGFIQNNGLISSTEGGTGIYVYGSADETGGTIINNGSIAVNGGIQAIGTFVTGNSVFTNNGEIRGSASEASRTSGLVTGTENAKLINTSSAVISGESYANGVYIEGGSLHNDGLIESENGYGIYSSGSEIFNNGKIYSNNTGIYAARSSDGLTGSTLKNTGLIIVNSGTGVHIAESTGENEGDIIILGDLSTGIYVESSEDHESSFTNRADITSDEEMRGTVLIKLDGGTTNTSKSAYLYNSGWLKALGDNSVAIYSVNNGEIHNTGDITINNGIGIRLVGSVLDEGGNTGLITVQGSGTGILAESSDLRGAVLNNDGKIEIEGNGTGIYVSSGNADVNGTTGKNTGKIHIGGEGGTGIYVTDKNTSFINTAKLTSTGANVTGISATNYGSVGNSGVIHLTEDGSTGIDISNNGKLAYNTALITVKNGTGISINNSKLEEGENTGIISVSGINGTGIKATDSEVVNNGAINAEEQATAIYGKNSHIKNSGEIFVLEGTGIKAENSSVVNESTGTISLGDGINADLINSVFENKAVLNNENGIVINGDNSQITNTGGVNAMNGTAVYIQNNSSIVNNGILGSTARGIDSRESTVVNNGVIDAKETGIYAFNNEKTVNTGEIKSKTGVEIISGSKEFSGHFLNTGTISGTEYAVKFDDFDNVLELGNGSIINGNINAFGGENILILSGNVNTDNIDNFDKIVSNGNSEITGTINLSPSINNNYYTQAFSNVKNMSDLSEETALGELTVSGTVNVGVDYDNISKDTDKTGKIIASSLNMKNGSIVLYNAGNTKNDIITESGSKNTGDQIRVKNIFVSNKQQAVNPEFRFQVSGDLSESEGWKRETVSRIENGVTVLDELYTNVGNEKNTPEQDTAPETDTDTDTEPVPAQKPTFGDEVKVPDFEESNENQEKTLPKPEPAAAKKLNSVPRNRVDLDNVNRISTISEKALDMEAQGMKPGEVRQSIEYTGTKGSDFTAENMYNYDYNVNSDGIAAVTLYKHTDNLYSGFTLGYTDNKINYANNDNEKLKSTNADIFGRYKTGNLNIDGHFGYGYNQHELSADWLGSGRKNSSYDSHVIKTGVKISYDHNLGNSGLTITPSAGADYVIVNEKTIKTDGMSDIEAAKGEGATGKIGIEVGNTEGKFIWRAGIGYEQNFNDTFHNERKMVNNYTMEKLSYGKETITAKINADIKVTDKLTVKTGYEYENNSNYENHKINAGISYTFGEK